MVFGDEMGNSFPCEEGYLYTTEQDFQLTCSSCFEGDPLSQKSCKIIDNK